MRTEGDPFAKAYDPALDGAALRQILAPVAPANAIICDGSLRRRAGSPTVGTGSGALPGDLHVPTAGLPECARRPACFPQLSLRTAEDPTNPLGRNVELLSHFGRGMGALTTQPEIQPDD